MAGDHSLPVERARHRRSDARTDFWNPARSCRRAPEADHHSSQARADFWNPTGHGELDPLRPTPWIPVISDQVHTDGYHGERHGAKPEPSWAYALASTVEARWPRSTTSWRSAARSGLSLPVVGSASRISTTSGA